MKLGVLILAFILTTSLVQAQINMEGLNSENLILSINKCIDSKALNGNEGYEVWFQNCTNGFRAKVAYYDQEKKEFEETTFFEAYDIPDTAEEFRAIFNGYRQEKVKAHYEQFPYDPIGFNITQ